MKLRLLLIALMAVFIISFMGTTAQASNSGTGIGIIIGEPTGLSLKFGNFPVLGIAWSFDEYIHLHCDYWLKNAYLGGPFDWFIGVGGKLLIYESGKDDNIGLGLRIPIGLQLFVVDNLEIFGEVAPGILLIPNTDFDIDAGIGLRFYI
ncbi:MAG: DUF3996 domain-containing protein [Spirochaetes bacterium]|nr:DUF3996 domain-containing protein [Spirochaetota bacterium]